VKLERFRSIALLLTACVAGGPLAAQTADQPLAQESQPLVGLGAAADITPLYPATTNPQVYRDPSIRLAEAPSLPADDPLGIAAQEQAQAGMPPGARQGIFQKSTSELLYLPRFEGDSLGITGLTTADVVFGFPFPRRDTPLLVNPRHRVLFLDGPDFTDVPPRVHEAELGLQHFRPLGERWMLNAAVTVGMYADDHSFDSSDAFRVTGRALGIYELSSQWKGILGVVYLNRAGYSVVPAAGLTYDRGDLKLDLVFPRPRIAWLMPGCSPTGSEQKWLYLMGELGGNVWAVNRTTGAEDTLSYSDIRLILGFENKVIGGMSSRTEIGYALNRELEYDSQGFESELDDTLFLRFGSTY